MKILMASSYFASHNGGLERVAGELFRAFADRGEEIVWMAGDVTAAPDSVGRSRTVSLRIFNFLEGRTGIPFPIPAPSTLRQIVREVKDADILILHDCLYLSNILTFLVARIYRVPTVIIQHTRYFPNESPLVNAVIKACTSIVTKPMLSQASQVVFIGETTKDFFSGLHFKRPPEVIFNGVNTDVFRKLEETETIPALRHQYELPEEDVVILFVGRFVTKKGLSVMKRMVRIRPNWTWAFAGWGPLDPTQWNAPNVRVFSGLSGLSLAPLYRCCDLLVLPSSGEGGFPLVAREALASGIPVVCSKETLGGDPAITEFVTGAPVYPLDEGATAREFVIAIEKSLGCGIKLKENSPQSKTIAALQNSWYQAADQYIGIISSLVPQKALKHTKSEISAERRCG
ncbi:MAG: glycosyltransferase family 4 protein [Acidobacteriaceae bacterium]